jgi:hypothetical protein
VNGTGVLFFREFIDATRATTIRRLPMFEMSELEFYSWWPLRVVLVLFVVNMVTATVRRIAFDFKHLGVLTVHAGIVVIALSSVFYQSFKREGDTILLASSAAGGAAVGLAAGSGAGPAQGGFYDNTRVALFLAQRPGMLGQREWEQRVLSGVPRYNAYGLDAGRGASGESWWSLSGLTHGGDDAGRELSRRVPVGVGPRAGELIDSDLAFELVGYAPYAELREDWVEAQPPASGASPMAVVEMVADLPAEVAAGLSRELGREIRPGEPLFRFPLKPRDPAHRVRRNELLTLEWRAGLDQAELAALTAALPSMPEGVAAALAVEVPTASGPVRAVVPAVPGVRQELGETGVWVMLEEFHPQPPFPIITEGYRGVSTSVAVVRVGTPDGRDSQRWAHTLFPELDQDIQTGEGAGREDGRPNRVRADESVIRIRVIDLSSMRVTFVEDEAGGLRGVVREAGSGAVRLVDAGGAAGPAAIEDVVEGIDLRVATRWAHAERVERPVVTPQGEQDRQFIGTHDRAALGVRVTSRRPAEQGGGWEKVVWLPFTKYVGLNMGTERQVALPDGRSISMAFGRVRHAFPGFAVRMVDFEMISYDHRGAPRDYQSVVRVEPTAWSAAQGPVFEAYEHVVKLNSPLRAPFHWDEGRAWASNMVRRLASGLNPDQFKLSQAGWDQQGWQQTQELVDQGVLDRPRAQFTILGVGNNPGIHLIALGGVMIAVGVPWAFYVKPWLVRRERDRVARRVASERAGRSKEKAESRSAQGVEVAV